jgi:hypothetical protein
MRVFKGCQHTNPSVNSQRFISYLATKIFCGINELIRRGL